LFGDRRGRRRLARGSEVKTDPTIASLGPGEDDTDISASETFTETIESETITRAVPVAASPRSQRPTTPIVDRKRSSSKQPVLSRTATGPQLPQEVPVIGRTPTGPQQPQDGITQPVPLDDLPTSIANPAVEVRSRNALIPIEDRPTPIAEPPVALALPLAAPERPTPYAPSERPTPPQRTSGLAAGPAGVRPTRLGTGDARPPRYSGGVVEPTVGSRTGTAVIAMPPDKVGVSVRNWLMFCALFALAVLVAVVVAML
jgi:hypothetical protein